MILSYVLYIGLLAFCWLCSYCANRYNNKKYIWLVILALTLVAGLRNNSVGIDTQSYATKFEAIARGEFQYAYALEESFKYICYAVLKVFHSTTVLLTLLAFLTNWCIITRFWELRKISSFSCMVLGYYMAFYFMTLNCMRQFCAVAIVFYSTRYLSQKKLWRYILGVLIAMLFHQSAVVGFVFLAVVFLRWKELSKKRKICYASATALILLLAVFALKRYYKYFLNPTLDIGYMIGAKLLFFLATMVFIFVWHRNYSYFPSSQLLNRNDHFDMCILCISYLIALCFSAFGYAFPNASRISWYFYLFEGVYLGMLLKGKRLRYRVAFGCIIACLLGYIFLRSMLHNSQGTMPYLFFWQ